MGVRRQIYMDEADERLLEEESRAVGLSVSELIRRAIRRCYGAGRRLTWEEVFPHTVRAGTDETWVPDPLFDDDPGRRGGAR